MPFDDSLLDDVAKLPDDEALKFFNGMSEQERSDYSTALDARKNKPAVSVEMGTPQVESRQELPDFTQPQPPAYFTPNRSVEEPPVQMPQMTRQGMPLSGGFDAGRQALDLGKQMLQRHVGAPLVKGILSAAEGGNSSPVAEYMVRKHLLSSLGGEAAAWHGISPEERTSFEQRGEAASPKLLKATDLALGIPLNPVNQALNMTGVGGLSTLAESALATNVGFAALSKVAPVLSKVLSFGVGTVAAGVENAGINAATSLADPKASVVDAAKEGFQQGVAFHGLIKTATGVAKATSKAVGYITGHELQQVSREAQNLPPEVLQSMPPDLASKAEALLQSFHGTDWEAAKKQEVSDDVENMFAASEDRTPKTITGGPGHEMPIDKFPGDSGQPGRDSSADWTGVSKAPPEVLPTQVGKSFDEGAARQLYENLKKEAQSDVGTNPGRKSAGALVMQDPAGRISFEPVLEPARDASTPSDFAEGDRVTTSAGDTGTLKTVKPNGKAVIVAQDGTKSTVDTFNLRAATNSDVLEGAAAAGSIAPGLTPEAKSLEYLKKNPRSGVFELAAHTGMHPEQARSLLGDLESQGLVEHDGDEWDITPTGRKPSPLFESVPKTPAPKEGPAFAPGDKVYISGRNGLGASEVVGYSGDKAIIKSARNTLGLEEVNSSLLRAVAPPGIAQTKGVVPGKPGLEGGPPIQGDVPDYFTENVDKISGMLKTAVQQLGEGKIGNFFKQFVDPRMRAPTMLRSYIRELQAVKNLDLDRQAFLTKLEGMFPGQKAMNDFRTDFDKALKAKTPQAADAIMAAHGAAWTDVQDQAHQLMSERSALDVEFKRLTGQDFGDHLSDSDGLMNQYAARRYWSRVDPKSWAQLVTKDETLLADTIKFVQDMHKDKFIADDAVKSELLKILHADNWAQAWGSSKLNPAYGSKSMLSRKDIPEQLRKFMGEWQDGVLNLAETMGTQRALVQHLQVWENITKDPRAFSPGPPAGAESGNFVQVPNDPARFGAASNGYVRKEIWEPVANSMASVNRSADWVQVINRFMKGNLTKWNPRTHLKSFVDNLDSAVAHGGLNPLNPVEAGRLMSESHQALKAYAADPTADGPGKIVYEGLRYGYHWGGNNTADIRGSNQKVLAAFDEVFGNPQEDLLAKLNNLGDKTLSPVKWLDNNLGVALNHPDEVIRLAANIGLRRRLLAEGKTVEEAAMILAERTNRYFMNANNPGRFVEAARNGGTGVAAPFITATAEDLRRTINMTRDFSSHLLKSVQGDSSADLGFLARMGAWHGLTKGIKVAGVAGGIAYLWDKMQGNDDMTNALANRTQSSKTYAPGSFVLPLKDDKGRFQVWDGTGFSFPDQLLVGDTTDSWVKRMFVNSALMPFSNTVQDQARKIPEAAGFVRPMNTPQAPGTGSASLMNVLSLMSQAGVLPIGPAKVAKDIANMTDRPTPSDVPLTGGQVAARAVGLPISPVPPTRLQAAQEFQAKMGEATKSLSSGVKQGDDRKAAVVDRIKQLTSLFTGK